jgi:hypothetical protein
MLERKKNQEIAALYIQLASACFTKSAASDEVGVSETFKGMAHVYVVRAVALDPSLHTRPESGENRKIDGPDRQRPSDPEPTSDRQAT